MIRFLLRQGWGNYLAILAIWWMAWLLPQMAGDWYDLAFHTFQAAIPLFLIYAVFALTNAWWRKELGIILVLQIVHNLGDVLIDAPFDRYNFLQTILNGLELAIIIGAGLPTLAIKTLRAYRDVNQSRASQSDARHRMSARQQGISRHVT